MSEVTSSPSVGGPAPFVIVALFRK